MPMDLPLGRITELLKRFHEGDRSAYNELFELTYQVVRAIAKRRFQGERPGHTLQPTALANEVFSRLVNTQRLGAHRGEFLALVATVIEHVLVDYARKRAPRKRREAARIEIDGMAKDAPEPVDVLALGEALSKLEHIDERRCRVVRMRFFLGMTIEQIATDIGMSVRSVHSDLTAARLWLLREMAQGQK